MSRAALLQPNQTAATTIRKCALATLRGELGPPGRIGELLIGHAVEDDADEHGEERRLREQDRRLSAIAQLQQQVSPRQRHELAEPEIAAARSLGRWRRHDAARARFDELLAVARLLIGLLPTRAPGGPRVRSSALRVPPPLRWTRLPSAD